MKVLQYLHESHDGEHKCMVPCYSPGASPAYYAAQEGRLEVLEYLCEKCRCDVSTACNDGLKPIHAASQCGHTNIIRVTDLTHGIMVMTVLSIL